MPNQVMYVDEKTDTKALKALFGEGALDFGATIAAIERLQAVGILFAEASESKPRGPRTKAEEAEDQLQAGVVPAQ